VTNLNPENLWKSVKGELEIVANPAHFKTHIPGTYVKQIDEENKLIEITSPSEFQKNFIEDRLYGYLREIISKVVGPEYKLHFTVTKKDPEKLSSADLGPLFQNLNQSSETSIESNRINNVRDSGLNSQYKIERFVVGSNNRLAYAVSSAIINDPGKVYNPFFLYSGVGLGKTHLVQSIGLKIIEKHPSMTVIYVTGEQFLNEVVEAVRKGGGGGGMTRTALKKKYRNADVLIIDDVHAIAGRDITQEEFFHTFNALYMSNKQIILTSDRAPNEIKTLEERLSSRFASGMIADIQKPDWETRLAILKNRNEEMKLGASDDVLSHLASSIDSNIRELEAKLLQVATRAKAEGLKLDLETAGKFLGVIDSEKAHRVTPNTIIKEVSKYYGITIKDLKGDRRLKTLAWPRQICMYLLRNMIDMGLQSIGNLLGNRDHTTILHGIQKVDDTIIKDPGFIKELNQLKTNITTGENL
jgi:chromosomal replication initiator protein